MGRGDPRPSYKIVQTHDSYDAYDLNSPLDIDEEYVVTPLVKATEVWFLNSSGATVGLKLTNAQVTNTGFISIEAAVNPNDYFKLPIRCNSLTLKNVSGSAITLSGSLIFLGD